MAVTLEKFQEMQEKLKTAQESLASVEVTGASGGGMVEVVMTCRYDVRRVSIDDALASDDKEVLEDLIAAAVNDAVRRVEQVTQEKMGGTPTTTLTTQQENTTVTYNSAPHKTSSPSLIMSLEFNGRFTTGVARN